MTDLQWQELVEKTRKGDKKAFEKLYNETKRSVYFTALKLLANEDNAKDVMQDTFIAAIEKLADLKDGSKFPKWVNSIAVNKCRRYFRAHVEESVDELNEQGVEFKDDDTLIPGSYVDDEVRRKVLMDIIMNELTEVQRRTIILYYYNEMSLEEIAEAMDCPVKTVSSRLCSAREKIRKAVITYEKKNNDRLHAMAPVPILTLILQKEAESLSIPDISLELFANSILDAAAKATASTLKASTAAGGKIMTGALKVKILAGVLAVTAVGSGTAVIVNSVIKKDDKQENRPEITEVYDDEKGYAVTADPEMGSTKAEILASARASSEANEFTFGKYKDDYKDPEGGIARVALIGKYYIFTEESAITDQEEVTQILFDKLDELLVRLSDKQVAAIELSSYTDYLSERVVVELANENDIYIDKVTFQEIRVNDVDVTDQSVTIKVPDPEKLSDESAAIIEKARGTSEATEFKFGTADGYKYIDPNEGEITVKLNGRFYLFEEESGNITGNQAKDKWMAYIPEVLEYMSAQKISFFDLSSHIMEISDQLIAKAANRDGIYIDRIVIASISSRDMEGKEPAETTEPWVVDESYELPVPELSAEMNTKLNEAKETETPVEAKFGTYSPIPCVDNKTGERMDISLYGTFTFYPEASGIDEENAKLDVLVTIQPIIYELSCHYTYDEITEMDDYIADRIIAEAANNGGLLVESVHIEKITKVEN